MSWQLNVKPLCFFELSNSQIVSLETGFQWDEIFLARGTKRQTSLYCPGTKGRRDKLKILPRNRLEQDFDILPQNGPGRDFDSLSIPGISRDKGTAGQVNFFVPGHDFWHSLFWNIKYDELNFQCISNLRFICYSRLKYPVHQTRYFKLENFKCQMQIDWGMLVNALLIKMTLQNWFSFK